MQKVRWLGQDCNKCGLQCKGLQCHSNMSYMGIEWTFENDMATIRCPYEKKECRLKHKYLQENKVLRYECKVYMTDEEYCYEGSVEHILKLHDDEIRRQEVSFRLQKNGQVYDVKISYLRNDLNGILFEGQVDTRIIKGKKLFDHPVSMDIGKICARLCQDRIREKVRRHYFPIFVLPAGRLR